MAGSFSADVSKWVNGSRQKADKVSRMIALEVFKRVIMRTPVDTGRARSNWQCSIGSPIAGVVSTTDKGGGATVQNAATVLQQFGIGKVAYLMNNLPYISHLEYGLYPNPSSGSKTVGGFSIQAPQGMVRVSLMEVSTAVNEGVRKGLQS
jgi:hypothetical protein